ncbi:MAG: hypothetical protein M1827_004919 [Pycnora praestabilis]|nr:MAG: hypothetical protein M1827_004919 [Pycnora praestabilis]
MTLASVLQPQSSAIHITSTVAGVGVDYFSPTSTTVNAFIAAATAIAAAVAGTEKGSKDDGGSGECELLGPFSLFIQGALGLLALLSLVFKRWRERPQRPLKVWAFDASKQVVGSALLHVANLLMSLLSSGQFNISLKSDSDYSPNPCSFYILNLAIDTTLGIPILVILLRLLTYAFSLTPLGNPPESIQSGHYGQPPKATWWFKQSIIYFLGLFGMKICVFCIFQILPWISRVGDWALKWTEGNEQLQVFFVMLFFPVVMNALQYYIIDSFIKGKNTGEHEPIPSEDGDDHEDDDDSIRRRVFENSTNGLVSGGDPDAEARKGSGLVKESECRSKPANARRVSNLKVDPGEYNPDIDGENTPTVVGSASNSEGERLLPSRKDKSEESLGEDEAGVNG